MSDTRPLPPELHYTKDHEWVRVEGTGATVGITDHAQHALGEITYVEIPPAGKRVKQFEEIAVVESAKAASDIFAPLSGVVTEANAELDTLPEKINEDPYGEGWICKLGEVSAAEVATLLTPAQYQALLEKEEA